MMKPCCKMQDQLNNAFDSIYALKGLKKIRLVIVMAFSPRTVHGFTQIGV